jgi:hypothetical protein
MAFNPISPILLSSLMDKDRSRQSARQSAQHLVKFGSHTLATCSGCSASGGVNARADIASPTVSLNERNIGSMASARIAELPQDQQLRKL